MRPLLAVVAALTLSACSGCVVTQADPHAVRCVIDGLSLERSDAVIEGVTRWEQATHGAFACTVSYEKDASRALDTIVFRDAIESAEHAGDADVALSPEFKVIDCAIGLDPKESGGMLTRLVTHELGHALSLRFAHDDAHYVGSEPSVMHHGVPDDADAVQPVDVDAFRARWK